MKQWRRNRGKRNDGKEGGWEGKKQAKGHDLEIVYRHTRNIKELL